MKITFIYPDLSTNSQQIHHGIASLSAVLKQDGHQTSLIHLLKPMGREELLVRVAKESPGLVAFSATSNMFPYVQEWAGWIKNKMASTLLICGGIHPTLAPEESLRESRLDMVCVGEGEYPLRELCRSLERDKDFTNIQSLWVKRDGKIFRNPIRPLIDPLDELPLPDRSLFDLKNLIFFQVKGEVFMASRGCPYQCSYCCNHALQKVYSGKGKYVRFRSVNHILKEIEEVLQKYSYVKYIYFDDDILSLKKDWFRDFCREYKSRISRPFSCNLRADLVDEEVANLLKDAGCFQVKMGIESGNEYIRNKMLERRLSTEEIKRAYGLCHKRGMRLAAYNMVGMPFEDSSQILETIKLNAQVGVKQVGVSIFYPYFGTSLYQLCREKNLLTDRILSSYFDGTVLRSSLVSKERLIFFRVYFEILVKIYSLLYKLPASFSKPLINILDKVLCRPYLPSYFLTRISFLWYPRKALAGLKRKFLNIVTNGL